MFLQTFHLDKTLNPASKRNIPLAKSLAKVALGQFTLAQGEVVVVVFISIFNVVVVVRISDNVPVAIKHVARSKVIAWDTVNGYKVPQELKFLLDVQEVEGVVKVLDFYERDDSFIYIMEKPTNYMDMFDFITKEKKLSETMAR